ncbi:MAG: type II secretion system F family protein [Candidatus Woesearchaeota archaeon]|jgi:pilus assembly protein TadC|nr:type II secretion system F family protein [Candidatus Woesearchaeota archaeon]MDP7622653.1 type II secretion system F family protein [Candidatus Woesearchaeota archaeon]HJN57260.1 type II secretion system F family protein [Candidatus Woesearchaeota archaeon]|tara:strand:- start:2559 stop:3374 length:816 start_codon:yes stop_codon:yes gene_type:complete
MRNILFQIIAKSFPKLRFKLKKAGMNYKPEEFVKRTFLSAFYMTTGIAFFFVLILAKFDVLRGIMVIFIPIIFFMLFSYLLRFPDVKISKKEKEISKEIVFAGRYLVIELESGVPLYNAFANISKNYEVIGQYFKEINNKVDLGTSMHDALTEAVEYIPSDNFRRILWQILNSIRTGSDVAQSLISVLEQIAREQTIEVDKYSKKLNPLAMFYMIIAVILPSLGVTMIVVFSSFVKFEIGLTALIFIAFLLGFVQFMFLSVIKFSRPAIEF